MLFGLTYIGFAAHHVLVGFTFSKMSRLVDDVRMREMLGFVWFFARWIVGPLVRFPSVATFVNILPMFIVGGYYLSFFFIISHNFEGVYLEENGAGVTIPRIVPVRSGRQFSGADWIGLRISDSGIVRGVSISPLFVGLIGLAILFGALVAGWIGESGRRFKREA
eukprot:gene11958-15237_t